jgi:hypothetical protein
MQIQRYGQETQFVWERSTIYRLKIMSTNHTGLIPSMRYVFQLSVTTNKE